jgi:selenide, water dikinase
MATLNKNSASLMLKYESHGATDVTGFGIMGHAQNLAEAQFDKVDLVMNSLPIINKMEHKFDGMPDFAVAKGWSAETSGGILCMLPKDKARGFMQEHMDEFGHETWIVGEVVKGSNTARITDDREIVSINKSFLH